MARPPVIFDRSLIARRLAAKTKPGLNFITKLVLEDLSDRLATISRPFNKALLLAPDIANLPNTLQSANGPFQLKTISTLLVDPAQSPVDPEHLILEASDYDLIISLFDVGITNDVPGFLAQVQKHLSPDGLFIAAFIGGSSLSELRAAWLVADAKHLGGAVARIAPFIEVKDAGSLLQRAGFTLPVTDIETLNLGYASPMHLMAELKSLGASNPLITRRAGLMTPDHLESANRIYLRLAAGEKNRVRATVQIVWMSGWCPDQNQPKPLKPGSAKTSMTSFLGKDRA